MVPWVALLALFATSAEAAQLPFGHACRSEERDGRCDMRQGDSRNWWAQVNDKVFYPPSASMTELSQDISFYYHAVGHPSALTDKIKAYRVGGGGHHHIFHLPEGPSMLSLPSAAGRRSGFSSLMQLREGTILGEWPVYRIKSGYQNPLTPEAQELERRAVSESTPARFQALLEDIVRIGASGVETRSYSNAEASKAAQEFLQNKFLDFGLSSCLDEFSVDGKQLANVIATVPGTTRADESLIMLAHYDSRPFSGPAPGAEDNGSGVAAMLLAAQIAAKYKFRPDKTIVFVAAAGEELNLLGSAHLVELLQNGSTDFRRQLATSTPQKLGSCRTSVTSFLEQKRRRRRVGYQTALVFDEVGWVSPKRASFSVNLETRDDDKNLRALEHLAQANMDHNHGEMHVEHNSRPYGSDHQSFLTNNESAILIINGNDGDYPQYHSSQDTVDHVNFEYGNQVTRMAIGGMMRIASVRV